MVTGPTAITLFVVGFVVAIMIHEWGHYWTARRFGMRVEKFFLGFGPTLWSIRRGETEYGVKLLPLGGFVRIKGMSPADERLLPVVDAVLDPEAIAASRRRAADRTGTPLTEVPAIPATVWTRLDGELALRGTPRDVRERIGHRLELNVHDSATPAEARLALTQILASEVTDTGRVGDLHHRLLKGDEGRFFQERPAWQRAIVLASGSAAHFLQAFALLFVGFLLFGRATALPELASVEPDSAAAEAGLEVGDRILAIDGEPVSTFEAARDRIRDGAGTSLVLTIARGDERFERLVVPNEATDPETGERIGLLGFRPAVRYSAMSATAALTEAVSGPTSVPRMTVETLRSLGRVFGPDGVGAVWAQVTGGGERDAGGAISMVGAARAAGDGTEALGPLFLFFLLASVNVFVGIFNILPLPPLDGGHLAVLGVEQTVNGIRRRQGRRPDFHVDPQTVAAIALPVIVFIGTLSLALVWLDVVNPVRITP